MKELQAVLFSLDAIKCGVQTEQVQEIVQYQKVESISEMPGCIEGVINLRGNSIPVISLDKRLKAGDSTATNNSKIIVSNVNGIHIGFIVDEVSEIMKFSGEDVDEPSEVLKRVSKDYISSIGKKNEELYIIIDLEKILNEKEFKQLEEKKLGIIESETN